MSDFELLTAEAVKRSALHSLELGKQVLLEEGAVPRHACLYTVPGAMKKLPKNVKIETEFKPPGTEDIPDEKLGSCVILDLEPSTPDLMGIIIELFPHMEALFGMLDSIGTQFYPDEETRRGRMVEIWLRSNNIRPPELIGSFFKHMIKKLEAYAFVHTSETWHVSTPTKERKYQYLEDDPNASEALMVNWETKDDGELLILPFTREARGEGKVLSFGELKTCPMELTEGRLSSLLYNVKDLDAMRATKEKE